ncbi:hypothetical protein BH24ACT15_BH24ACT15_19250 [soil metagenome]|jgi:hypothetical protein
MIEVLWVTLFGAALAWLQSRSNLDEQTEVQVPVDDEWTRWEEEIHDWKQS